jgi:predicted Rossmann fold flavoprotein
VDTQYDAIILGAGAAGLMCAIEAGKRRRRVLVLERAERIGKKILISGGGRCNFTNVHTGPENFLSSNPHFAKSALARYTPADFLKLVEKHRIPYNEKKLGQLFCDGSAREIVAMLEQECRDAGVDVRVNTRVTEIRKDNSYALITEAGTLHASRLVVATGGLSIPKLGATSFGYDLARQFGLKIQSPRAALVPFVFSEADRKRWCDLAGISCEVIASVDGCRPSFQEKMLFTHRGLSGPAILQISSYWEGTSPIVLDLAPGRELSAELRANTRRTAATWKSLLREILPRRFADRWLELHPLATASGRAFADAERELHAWKVLPETTEGFGKAEVTAGGLDPDELSARTMESHRVPGLYFVGEVVDVTGHLGGFNFQWAWASGYSAGQAI